MFLLQTSTPADVVVNQCACYQMRRLFRFLYTACRRVAEVILRRYICFRLSCYAPRNPFGSGGPRDLVIYDLYDLMYMVDLVQ